MAEKLILVILDGLRFDVARSSMGYLGHLVETAQSSLYRIVAELPTLSRPLYEVLLTGTPASINGITANDVARPSDQTSLFHLATQQGLTTAAHLTTRDPTILHRRRFCPRQLLRGFPTTGDRPFNLQTTQPTLRRKHAACKTAAIAISRSHKNCQGLRQCRLQSKPRKRSPEMRSLLHNKGGKALRIKTCDYSTRCCALATCKNPLSSTVKY
jgi:hypothetical protein